MTLFYSTDLPYALLPFPTIPAAGRASRGFIDRRFIVLSSPVPTVAVELLGRGRMIFWSQAYWYPSAAGSSLALEGAVGMVHLQKDMKRSVQTCRHQRPVRRCYNWSRIREVPIF